jgi:hypothetical protein
MNEHSDVVDEVTFAELLDQRRLTATIHTFDDENHANLLCLEIALECSSNS